MHESAYTLRYMQDRATLRWRGGHARPPQGGGARRGRSRPSPLRAVEVRRTPPRPDPRRSAAPGAPGPLPAVANATSARLFSPEPPREGPAGASVAPSRLRNDWSAAMKPSDPHHRTGSRRLAQAGPHTRLPIHHQRQRAPPAPCGGRGALCRGRSHSPAP